MMKRRASFGLLLLVVVACGAREPAAPEVTPGDPEALRQLAREVHERVLVLDAHADIEIPGKLSAYVGADGRSRVAPDKLRAGGVDAVVMAAAVGPGPRDTAGYALARARAEEEVAAVRALAKAGEHRAVMANSPDEVITAHEEGMVAFILGLQNALILGTEVDGINEFYDAGVRVFALTHMGHNDFADSSRPLYLADAEQHEPEAEHGGLSDLGRQAIRRINELGGVVDVSQLSRQATLQAIEESSAPVIATHSNVRALTDVSRNLSDEEIDRIGETDGVIHLAPFRGYLYDSSDATLDQQIRAARREAGLVEDYYYPFELYWELEPDAGRAFAQNISELLGPGSIAAMLDHLDYIVERIGIEHVGIGTDFNHGGGVAGFEDASGALEVTLALLQRGYSEEDIGMIWSGNFLRVWRAAERGSS